MHINNKVYKSRCKQKTHGFRSYLFVVLLYGTTIYCHFAVGLDFFGRASLYIMIICNDFFELFLTL